MRLGGGGLGLKICLWNLCQTSNFAFKNIGDSYPKFCPLNFRYDPKQNLCGRSLWILFQEILSQFLPLVVTKLPKFSLYLVTLLPNFASKLEARSTAPHRALTVMAETDFFSESKCQISGEQLTQLDNLHVIRRNECLTLASSYMVFDQFLTLFAFKRYFCHS